MQFWFSQTEFPTEPEGDDFEYTEDDATATETEGDDSINKGKPGKRKAGAAAGKKKAKVAVR